MPRTYATLDPAVPLGFVCDGRPEVLGRDACSYELQFPNGNRVHVPVAAVVSLEEEE